MARSPVDTGLGGRKFTIYGGENGWGHSTQHSLVDYLVGRHQAFEFFKPVQDEVDLGFFLDRTSALVRSMQFFRSLPHE